jgi:CelD/BcsL family acetyltransferase involved in cellulose biosynthesis
MLADRNLHGPLLRRVQYQVAQHGRNLRYDADTFLKENLLVADFDDLALSSAQERRARMTLSIIRDAEADERIGNPHFRSQWTQLYEACPWSTGCQSPGFVIAWQEAYRDRYSPLMVCEFCPSGDLTGLLSLATEKSSGRVVVVGAGQTEYKVWLALPSNGSSFIEAALAQLASETNIRTLSLRYLPPGTPTDWITGPGRRAWMYQLEKFPRPIIPVADAAELAEYVKKKKSGKSTKNSWNRFKRLGNLTLERIHDAEQLAAVFDELIVYYDLRQGGLHGKFSFREDPAKKPYHLGLLRTPNVLHVTILKAGPHTISASFGITNGKVYSWAMPMISPFHAIDSPMKIHLLMLLEQLHQEGYSTFDLTSSMDSFKERFAATYDSVQGLSIYFRRSDLIKQKIRQRGEKLARRALHSLRIAPNSALEHVQQLRRVPLATWPSILARELIALVKKPWSATAPRIYVLAAKNVRALEDAALMSRDHLDDLLTFESTEVWRTRSSFLVEALKRIEIGHHFYTRVENGRLVHISWLVENQKANVIPGTDKAYQFPPGSAVLYGAYTDPGARGRGLFRAALRQMLPDAAGAPGAQHIFMAVPPDDRPACEAIEEVGFVPLSQPPKQTSPASPSEQAPPAGVRSTGQVIDSANGKNAD